MFTFLTRKAARPDASARLRRATAALAALVGGVLDLGRRHPGRLRRDHPRPRPRRAYGPAPAAAPAPAPVITAGMSGWQITPIAVAAALVAAAADVLLDRARASRRTVPAAR